MNCRCSQRLLHREGLIQPEGVPREGLCSQCSGLVRMQPLVFAMQAFRAILAIAANKMKPDVPHVPPLGVFDQSDAGSLDVETLNPFDPIRLDPIRLRILFGLMQPLIPIGPSINPTPSETNVNT